MAVEQQPSTTCITQHSRACVCACVFAYTVLTTILRALLVCPLSICPVPTGPMLSFSCFCCTCRLSHVGSSTLLSPSASTSLSRFSSSDYGISPGGQLTSPIASGLSSNSTNTNLGLSYFGNASQPLALEPFPDSPANGSRNYRVPNPVLGLDWLPQNPSLAAHLGQIRTEKQRGRAMPVDIADGAWGFDDFPLVPGMICINHCILEPCH